jgi:methylated-DNA-[protein]-cysteine S-methyltransferase
MRTDAIGKNPSKNRRDAAARPTGCALLDFRGGPRPELGVYGLAWDDVGLVRVWALGEEADLARFGAAEGILVEALPERFAVLAAFARGEPVDVGTAPVHLTGPPFFQRVWARLRGLGRGRVCTYAQLARAVRSERAVRAVGQAMARNPLPIVVPCHRVVADHGKLGGYTGGTARKRALLSLEGVEVDGDVVRPGQLDLEGTLDRRATTS